MAGMCLGGQHGQGRAGGRGQQRSPFAGIVPGGCSGLGAEGGCGKGGTLSDSLGAVRHPQPSSPHRGAGSPLSPRRVSPSSNRPQICSLPHTAPPGGPTAGDGLQPPPPGSPLPHPLPQDGCTQGHPQGVVTEPALVATCGGVSLRGLQLPQLRVMGSVGPEGPR